MKSGIQTVPPHVWEQSGLARLKEMPQPPKTLYSLGALPSPSLPLLTVVGSRKYSTYGKQVVEELIDGLRSYDIGIISGLALGIDGIAHQAALKAGLYTLAIPGSGLERSVLYPARHRILAEQIVKAGGCLISELSPNTKATRWSFPQRNRLMAALGHATILIEAQERSGTLITARLAVDYDRELLVVPGNIFSPNSCGVHQFLKLGATPITNSDDIVYALGLQKSNTKTDSSKPPPDDLTEKEMQILKRLTTASDIDTIVRTTGYTITDVNATMMHLEIKGYIRHDNGLYQQKI